MKTPNQVREWLKAQPWYLKFVTNTLKAHNGYLGAATITDAFDWLDSDEGQEFWENVNDQFMEWFNSNETKSMEHEITIAHRPEFKVRFVGGKYDGLYTREEALETVPVIGETENLTEVRAKGGIVHRKELDCQPIFDGYLGPMWGEDCLWYETPEVYRAMSR